MYFIYALNDDVTVIAVSSFLWLHFKFFCSHPGGACFLKKNEATINVTRLLSYPGSTFYCCGCNRSNCSSVIGSSDPPSSCLHVLAITLLLLVSVSVSWARSCRPSVQLRTMRFATVLHDPNPDCNHKLISLDTQSSQVVLFRVV